jgi:hypothetical protein
MSTLPVGRHICVADAGTYSLGELPNEKKTPYAEVMFRCVQGEFEGQTHWFKGFLSEAAIKFTLQKLRTAGAEFPGGDITDGAGLGSVEVEIVVRQQKDSSYTEIAFVNDPNAKPEAKAMDPGKKADFRDRFRGAVLSLAAPTQAPKATGTGGKIPF